MNLLDTTPDLRAMRERPILFSAPMVRALLDGTKTQTRRVMVRQKQHEFTDYTLFGQRGHPDDEAERRGGWAQPWVAIEHAPDWPDGKEDQCHCPYAQERGDRLWVRETWQAFERGFDVYETIPKVRPADSGVVYAADEVDSLGRWRPSIHMPRWASRIDLEITDVRVERLQDISEADARAEGYSIGAPPCIDDPKGWYRRLWEQINGPSSWDANPWVWVVEFRRVKP